MIMMIMALVIDGAVVQQDVIPTRFTDLESCNQLILENANNEVVSDFYWDPKGYWVIEFTENGENKEIYAVCQEG